MKNMVNTIEAKYRELCERGLNFEFLELYKSIENVRLRECLATLHYYFVSLFRTMNERLPTGGHTAYFWAEPSRDLIAIIEITLSLHSALKESKYTFKIDEYYFNLIMKCRNFLHSSGGSTLPEHMNKVELYYTLPIFIPSQSIVVKQAGRETTYDLRLIGEGSYANVYKYRDTFYNRNFTIKRAKKELSDKELSRFKREYEEMQKLSSPYILEVYRYFEEENEYTMEYMDCTLEKYIRKNNNKLLFSQRKGIIRQILRAFEYIHSKNILHRDISPNNILLKEYEDVIVIKISDFGLVKIPDSNLTAVNTEFKGCFNDPTLVTEGFNTYGMSHEIYALTRIALFVLTGKTNTERIQDVKLKKFVEKGLNPDKAKRFESAKEMADELRYI